MVTFINNEKSGKNLNNLYGLKYNKAKGVRLKNNYNFVYVKFHLKRGYIQHVCALAF